eukprot:Gregarina_sp_Pseudo_9__1474@NODE_1997_length_1214_cov_101_763404_g1845_i0_p1_GENE_NODE_1997_length_1214_cov_101_763404_g1845_i0NODE_1997_length_1214_cov_101_763404_g1845_i0_p1_ORF_typecomplete_len231_score37_10_NODE_1997_length_1214_cov_101_763404_g1845_i0135827
MLFRLVAISAAVVLTQAAPVYSDFKVTSEAAECQIEACKKAAGEVAIADIEACLDATPGACTFSMSFVNSGTATQVCASGLGFSVEDWMPAVGTVSGWTADHMPTAKIDQGVESTKTCDIGVFAADGCEDADPESVGAMSTSGQPFTLRLDMVNPPTPLQAHTHILFQLTVATPSENCKKPITSVLYTDFALTLTAAGRVGEDGGNGNPESASAKMIAGLTLGVVAWLMY